MAALAASALFAPSADAQRREVYRSGVDTAVTIETELLGADLAVTVHDRDSAGYGRGYRAPTVYYAPDPRELRREAVRSCAAAIRQEGYRLGYREVEIERDDRVVRQIGPAGFFVTIEAEFEGRRRDVESDVTCEVRRGQVVALSGVPRPGHPRTAYRGGW